MRLLAAAMLLLAGPALAQEGWQPKGSAEIVLLDKIRAQPTAATVKVGESAHFGSITVAIRNCVARPPDQPADSAAFVDVTDTRGRTDIFHGWILARTPSISQMEHPVYALRLTGCR